MDLSVTELDSQNTVRAPAPPLEAVRIQYADRKSKPLALQGPPPRQSRGWVPLAVLGLITLIGGLFRFYRLTYPPLWNDEALVYWRVCGSYGQMLKPLSLDGFPPLHYSLYWLIGHYRTLTPFVMRPVPAISGTLTIPAINFLSRQMLPKSTSLVAAAFTACSAFRIHLARIRNHLCGFADVLANASRVHCLPMSPDIFRKSPFDEYKIRSNPDFNWFRRNIESAPQLNDVIIWRQLFPPQYVGQPHEVAFDPYGKILGSKWKMTSEQVSTVHNYWDWRERWKWVRREYVKK